MVEFIFMLTHDDVTVADARQVFTNLKSWRVDHLKYLGFKDIGLPPAELTDLCAEMHDSGYSVMLEVVSEHPEDERRSIAAAKQIGVDFVLGGVDVLGGMRELAGSGIHYFPFVGTIVGHPSLLRGPISNIAEQAAKICALDGVDGLDLLAYRYDGDPEELLGDVVKAAGSPVIAAGSIDSAKRIRAVAARGAWAFTVGSAIFDRALVPGGTMRSQVEFAIDAARTAAQPTTARELDPERVG
jgi:hypothetical protein